MLDIDLLFSCETPVCITKASVTPTQLLRRVWKIFRCYIRVSPDSLFREMAERIATNAASYEKLSICFAFAGLLMIR